MDTKPMENGELNTDATNTETQAQPQGGTLAFMLVILIGLGFFSLYINVCRPVWWDNVLISIGVKAPPEKGAEVPVPTEEEKVRDAEICDLLEKTGGVLLTRETGTQIANTLRVTGITFTDELAGLLGELKFLNQFTLENVTITPGQFRLMLQNKGWLRNFVVSGLKITPEMAETLPAMIRVRALSLTDADLDEKCLAHVRAMPEVTILDISGSRLSEEELTELAEMGNVLHLVVKNCGLTDFSLGKLKKMRGVKHLTIREGNEISRDGLETLRSAFSDIKID